MNHLFLCREFPPAAYPPGGIGTYVRHIARLLADAGDNVHVIAHRSAGAPNAREELMGGRLIVHRVALDDGIPDGATDQQRLIARGLLASSLPSQAFAWHAALLAERLIVAEGIDVVESQEWEAPLYYLQLRRELGLGPERRPPVVVHLHSSTEQIFAANGWDTTVADYAPAAAQEAYSIVAADALIAPSESMAQETQARYAQAAPVRVIPYPLGDMECIARSTTIWAGRTICQIGRLEPRKGVFECVDALVSIAADYPDLRVDFIGADTPLRVTGGPSVANTLRRRMPARVRHQLRFHGSLDPSGVRALLGRASAAVVPSRWENFPYSCIEAMASGLPAVVSPHGGMRELVDDGISGWIAESGSPAGIAAALRRTLDASGEQRERMGLAAAASVDRRCANDRVVRLHREWKRSIAQQASATATIDARPAHTRGIAVVVTGSAEPTGRAGIRSDLQAQSEAPALIMIAADDPVCGSSARAAPRGVGSGLPTSAIDTLLATPALLGVVWIDARLHLNPGALAACRRAFERDRFAVLSSWVAETGPPERVRVASNPARPAVRDDGLPAPLLAVSMSALRSAQRDLLADGGSVVDRICRSGAPTLIYPAVLGSLASAAGLGPPRQRARFSSMAKAIQRLHTPLWRWLFECSPEDRRDFVVDALRNPRQAIRWLARRLAAGSRLQPPGSTNPARNP